MPRGEIRVKNRPARSAKNPAPGGAFHMPFHGFSVLSGGFFNGRSPGFLSRGIKKGTAFHLSKPFPEYFYQSLSQLPPKSKSQLLPLSQS